MSTITATYHKGTFMWGRNELLFCVVSCWSRCQSSLMNQSRWLGFTGYMCYWRIPWRVYFSQYISCILVRTLRGKSENCHSRRDPGLAPELQGAKSSSATPPRMSAPYIRWLHPTQTSSLHMLVLILFPLGFILCHCRLALSNERILPSVVPQQLEASHAKQWCLILCWKNIGSNSNWPCLSHLPSLCVSPEQLELRALFVPFLVRGGEIGPRGGCKEWQCPLKLFFLNYGGCYVDNVLSIIAKSFINDL
jgi:hypothetical protein